MLRELLAELYHSPTASGLEIRSRLGLSRESYEDQLAHLVRMGYLRMEAPQAEEATCPTSACKGCAIACQSSPSLGPQRIQVTERGRRFLEKRDSLEAAQT